MQQKCSIIDVRGRTTSARLKYEKRWLIPWEKQALPTPDAVRKEGQEP